MAYGITSMFLLIDLTFFGANLLKLLQGGWLPIVIGASIFTAMTTWKSGRRAVAARLVARAIPIDHFLEGIAAAPPIRVPGTAVFMTAQPRGVPPALVHNLRHNKMLHEHVVLLTVRTSPVPHVAAAERVAVDALGQGVFVVRLLYGFMEEPHVPRALLAAQYAGLTIDTEDITYFLGRETLIVTGRRGMALWREKLFVLMARNSVRATAFFRLPPERVVELGVQVEI